MDMEIKMENEVIEEQDAILTYPVTKGNDQSQKQLAQEWVEYNGLGAVNVTDTVVKVWLLRVSNRALFLNSDGTAKASFTMVRCKDADWQLECRLREHVADPKKPYAVYDVVFS